MRKSKKPLTQENTKGNSAYRASSTLFMIYKTNAIDLEKELNERQYDGWILVKVVWNEDSDCYMAIKERF